MRVRLIAYTPDPEKVVVAAALTTVSRKVVIPEELSDDEIEKVIDVVIRRGHHSVLEHANFTFAIEGISRVTCYDEKTEVLTKNGWRPIKDVDINDEVACLDDDGKLVWHKPKAKIIQNYKGFLIRLKNEFVDLLVTPEHRMWIQRLKDNTWGEWEFIPIENLGNVKYKLKKNAIWEPENITLDCPLGLSDETLEEFFKMLGLIIMSDVTLHGDHVLTISHENPSVIACIKEICKRLGMFCDEISESDKKSVRIRDRKVFDVIKRYSLLDYEKKGIPRFIKDANSRQIMRFLEGILIAFQGSCAGPIEIILHSEKLAGDLQELFMKVGMSADIISNTNGRYVLRVNDKKASEPIIDQGQCSLEYYEGKVYSLVVPYHRLYVRRNGKVLWSGNSHQLVRHRIASYSQQSQRYVPLEEVSVYAPESISKADDPIKELFEETIRNSWEAYKKLIELGVNPEDARYVLPQATTTNIIVTMNARELLHFFSLRLCYRAQAEIRRLAIEMLKEVYKVAPRIFKHAGPRCKVLGYCPEEFKDCPLYKIFGKERDRR